MKTKTPPLPHGTLIELRRWNTPTIYNGLETYSKADRRSYVNLEEVHDFMPQMGPMVGYAITMVLQRKEAARGLARGLATLTIPAVPLLLLGPVPAMAIVPAVLGESGAA